ncbi:C25 family cysteine peptidase [Taibaiella sp. KBW10]|uniref:putative type IX secretion system sortase PorU2 n=1 Tax=Taibaiella sp. KBW10 TaxID=2153357 RepID=UPI001F27AE5C|nr:C25 family cysteine peptidase [Taibaiella sp. KBW10]
MYRNLCNKKTGLFSVILALVFFSNNILTAQPLGNEWINYSQTYFKFKVGENGIYRIPYSVLQSYGLSNVQGGQFALYREGLQLPVYVSTNGSFTAADYIEFYGTKANGKMDTEMYLNASEQPNDEVNSISDTAFYFITYTANSGGNTRLSLNPNTMPSNPPAAEAYCMTTAYPTTSLRTSFSNGESYYLGSELVYYYSGKYDKGEGWGLTGYAPTSLTYNTPNVYTGISAILQSVVFWNSKLGGDLKFTLNGNSIFDTAGLAPYNLIKRNVSVNTGSLSATNTLNVSNVYQYGYTIQKANLYYPRNYNFAGIANLNFDVPNNNNTQLISLTNVGSGTNALIDINTNNIYHLNGSGTINCILPPNGGTFRNLCYTQSPKNILALTPVTFKNYNLTANQGSYLILTDQALVNIPNSAVAAYKSYRTSTAGGAYNVAVIEANELYNQFGYGFDYHALAIKRFLKYAQSNSNWSSKPEYMFIIGKGLSYQNIKGYLENQSAFDFPAVPTYGTPGSDNLFAEIGNSNIPSIAIGRISVLNNTEVANYLEKIKSYEAAIKTPAVPNLENSLWKKKGLHIAGSQGANIQAELYLGLNACKSIIEDTLTGATIITSGKSSTDVIENASAQIDSLIKSGVQYVNFFGHASSSGFDYNLNSPENTTTKPRFPIFMAHGCDIANIFTLTVSKTISERYLDVANGGSIAMIACDNYGWTTMAGQVIWTIICAVCTVILLTKNMAIRWENSTEITWKGCKMITRLISIPLSTHKICYCRETPAFLFTILIRQIFS